MPTSVTVNDLKINELTKAQYDAAVQGGVIGENELSVITDMTDKAVQVSTMPTASATELGNIYQFTGTTDANYTNGYFYKCVSDGQDPATYAWTRIDVQPAGATYTAGTGIDITSGVISVENPVYVTTDGSGNKGVTIGRPLLNLGRGDGAVIIGAYNMTTTRNLSGAVVIGRNASTQWGGSVAIGGGANASGDVSVVVGSNSTASGSRAIQLGYGGTNSDANTFKVANANGNFMIMDANGNLPADRLASTTGLADGNYRLRCTITNGVPTLSWVAE